MRMKRMIPAILAFCVLLVGCRPRIFQHRESSDSSSFPTASAVPSELLSNPNEALDSCLERLYKDINGDNRDETILLTLEEGRLVLTVDDLRLVFSETFEDSFGAPFLESADVNGDGLLEILVFLDIGSTSGQFALYVIQLQGDALSFLPVPYFDEYCVGYTVEAFFEDHYKLSVYCPETNYHSRITLDPGSWLERDYYIDGKLEEDFPFWSDYDAASFYRLIPLGSGVTALEIWQTIWGVGHTDTLAFLCTLLCWEDGLPEVVNQMVIPYINNELFQYS